MFDQVTGLTHAGMNSRKITPGPYRATKLWNEIVRNFREKMPRRRHRRHLKLHSDCFTANEAINYLHGILKNNHNIGSEVSKHQTIKLLQKFLKNHVIEDIHGEWGSENISDNNHLYRFAQNAPGQCLPFQQRKPLSLVNENVLDQRKRCESKKFKAIKESKLKSKKTTKSYGTDSESSSSNTSSTSTNSIPSPPPNTRPLPPLPQCNIMPNQLSEEEINSVWRDVVIQKIKKTLHLKSLDDLLMPNTIKGEWIKHNASKIGKSGVVQVPIDQDLPYWALSAMTCLANWPNGRESGLPCYAGFEKDVLKAICDYYCHNVTSPPNPTSNKHDENVYASVDNPSREPLLTYDLYELFTNILCLLRPETNAVATEALQLSLMLLPPANRRKLHLLLRLMAKVCANQKLTHIGKHMSTRVFLLHTFSRPILACFEEVYLDELLAMRLVTFLIDNHLEVMKIPDGVKSTVEEQLERMKKPTIQYADGDLQGSFIQYSRFQSSDIDVKPAKPLARSKSVDVMKALKTNLRPKPSYLAPLQNTKKDTTKHRRSATINNISDDELPKKSVKQHTRSSTISSKVFNNLWSKSNKNPLKPAQSCPDICDRLVISPTPTNNNMPSTKSSAIGGSTRNIKSLINRLRRNRS